MPGIIPGPDSLLLDSSLLFSRVLFLSDDILEIILLEFWLLFTKVFASINWSFYWCCRLSYYSIILQKVPCRCDLIFLIFCLIDSSEMSSSDDERNLGEGGSCSLLCSFFKISILLLKSTSCWRRSSATMAKTGAKSILTFRGRYDYGVSLSISVNWRGVSIKSNYFSVLLPINSVGSESVCIGDLGIEYFDLKIRGVFYWIFLVELQND